MNETLEAIARALFRSWFVDFDPVRAKQEGRQPPGLDAATAALFPDSFEDSPLGGVPAGWKVRPLGYCVELKRGYDLPSRQREPGIVPIISSSGPSGRHSTAMVKGPGVVTGRYGTIGQVFFVEEDFWPLNTTLYACDFKGHFPRFIAGLLELIDFETYSDKAAVPGINRNHLHQESVVVPTSAAEERFTEIVEPIGVGA
jgi:type I restriction enzyme S subunit